MRRRDFITFVGTGAVAWPLAARSQQASGMRRIGVLMGTAAQDAESKAELDGFRDSLAKLGWIEGSTIHIDYRFPASSRSPPAIDCRQFIRGVVLSQKVVSWHTALTSSMRFSKVHPTSVVFCGVRTRLICQSRCPPNTKPFSISRLPKRWVFQCRHRFWCAPTR
jgi:hypothetical protein